jgi:outer membrane protein insertion porin family
LPVAAPTEGTWHLVAIDLQGCHRIPSARIRAQLGLQEGRDVSVSELRAAITRVAAMGTFQAIAPRLEPAMLGGFRLVLVVRENPVLTGIEVVGARHLSPAEVESAFHTQVGQVVAVPAVREALGRLQERYAQDGLILARVVLRGLSAAGRLRLEVREGVVEHLAITGNERTQEYVIRRELTLKPGELVTRDLLAGDLARLGRLGFFDDVKPVATPASGSLGYDLTFQVTERNTGRLSTNAGWNAVDGPLAALSVGNTNFLGRGESVRLGFSASRLFDPVNRTMLAEASFFEPWLDDRRTSLGAELYLRRLYNPFAPMPDGSLGFQEQHLGASLTLGKPLFGDPVATPWRGMLTLKGEQTAIAQADAQGHRLDRPAATASGTGRDLGVSVSLGLAYDTRNGALSPTDGWFFKAVAEQYVPFSFDLKLTRLVLEGDRFTALAPGLTLALSSRLGTVLDPWHGGIPLYQRFFSYGDQLMRGWPDGSLNGTSFALATLEGRFPLVGRLSGVVFGDTGAFWGGDGRSPTWASLRSGYGLGVRIDTPMGLLRADYGLNRWGSAGLFSIGIGQRF